MPDFIMALVSVNDPLKTAVLQIGVHPAFSGSGDLNYFCGNCGALIIQNGARQQISNLVIRCTCGSDNSVQLATAKSAIINPAKKFKRRKVRCSKCVHTNLILLVYSDYTVAEWISPALEIETIDLAKHIY